MSKMSLAVQKIAATGPSDIRDQRWLDERIAAIDDGMEAVLDIARNWTDGRKLVRLHPGIAAAAYVQSRVGTLGRSVIEPLLAQSNWSNRQIAAVAGVDEGTVRNQVRNIPHVDRPAVLGADGKTYPGQVVRQVVAEVIEPTPIAGRKPEEEPIDGRNWTALVTAMDAIESLTERDAALFAATVPERRRAATAKRLRKLGTYLGRIAWTLEGMEEPS